MRENICKFYIWWNLGYRIYKKKTQLNNIQITHVKNRQNNFNTHFSKEDIKMANKQMKRWSTSLSLGDLNQN